MEGFSSVSRVLCSSLAVRAHDFSPFSLPPIKPLSWNVTPLLGVTPPLWTWAHLTFSCLLWGLGGDWSEFCLLAGKMRSIQTQVWKQSGGNNSQRPGSAASGPVPYEFFIAAELCVHNRLIAVGVRELLWCHLHKSC